MIMVDDPAGGPDLPDEYGVDDIPVIVQDKTFDSDGQLVFNQRRRRARPASSATPSWSTARSAPYLDVPTTHVRLRLLNASTARIYKFGFADDRTFDVVGTDGGLLTAPVNLDRIQLSPGERAEIVVAIDSRGDRRAAQLLARLRRPGGGSTPGSGTGDYRVLELRAAATLRALTRGAGDASPRSPDPRVLGR